MDTPDFGGGTPDFGSDAGARLYRLGREVLLYFRGELGRSAVMGLGGPVYGGMSDAPEDCYPCFPVMTVTGRRFEKVLAGLDLVERIPRPIRPEVRPIRFHRCKDRRGDH